MMTVVAIMAGLLPILCSHVTGSEVMQRIVVPMVGGMVSSAILTLVVVPSVARRRASIRARNRSLKCESFPRRPPSSSSPRARVARRDVDADILDDVARVGIARDDDDDRETRANAFE